MGTFIRYIALLCCALLGVISVAQDSAPVPSRIRFSGKLPVAMAGQSPAVLGVTFAIYKEQQGGAPLWMETQNVRPDLTGRYTVLLGAESADGVPSELFVDGEARWLGVTPEGTPELPRVQFVTVPYAMKAADAETLGGRPASAYLLAPDPQNTNAVVPHSTTSTAYASEALSGENGVPGSLAKFLTPTSLGPSLITDTGSALGIRLSAPEQALDVLGRAQYRAEGANTAGFFLRGSDTTPQVFIGQSGSNSSDPFVIWHSGAWRFMLDSSGRVGIGAAPDFRLDVNGRMRVRGNAVVAGESAGMYFGPDGSSPALFIGQTGVDRMDPFAIWHGGTWRFILDSAGKVGIGAWPEFRLDVNGRMRVRGDAVVAAKSAGIYIGPDGSSPALFIGQTGVNRLDSFAIWHGGTWRFVVTSGGNVGIGTTSPTAPLEVAGNIRISSGSLLFSDGTSISTAPTPSGLTTADQSLLISTGSSPAIRVNDAGITSTHLAPNSVTSSAIADGAITAAKIPDGSITGTKLAAGSLPPSAVAGTAATLGLNFFNGDQNVRGGIFVRNYSTTGTSQALQARTDSNSGVAIQAFTNSTSGATIGLHANNPSSAGTAILAEATSTAATSTTYGVKSTTSGSGGSVAVLGVATATYANNPTFGLRGEAASQYGVGVFGYASSYSGVTKGVSGRVESVSGIAGEFTNSGNGTILAGSNATGRVFRFESNGDFLLNGTARTGGADFAEMIAVNGDRSGFEPGDVLVIAPDANRAVAIAHQAYSTSVAGVYSTKPGLLGSQHAPDSPQPENEIPLAVVGIVPCKATAENGPIQRGDLLVTSSVPGHVMKGTDRSRMLGAVVGKALSTLDAGTGIIEVLVTLQ